MGFQTSILQALLFFVLYPWPSSPIRACGQVDKQVRTKTPYWIYREFPRGSRIEKSSPVPLSCPSDRYYLGTTLHVFSLVAIFKFAISVRSGTKISPSSPGSSRFPVRRFLGTRLRSLFGFSGSFGISKHLRLYFITSFQHF